MASIARSIARNIARDRGLSWDSVVWAVAKLPAFWLPLGLGGVPRSDRVGWHRKVGRLTKPR